MDMKINPKPRKDPGSALWTDKDSKMVFVGKDYALQNQIEEQREKTRSRSCYKECRTCGACANSKRDNLNVQAIVYEDGSWKAKGPTYSYDRHEGAWIDCNDCEQFRYHDCHNGWLRDSRQDAEPFTPDMVDLIEKYGGKPLI